MSSLTEEQIEATKAEWAARGAIARDVGTQCHAWCEEYALAGEKERKTMRRLLNAKEDEQRRNCRQYVKFLKNAEKDGWYVYATELRLCKWPIAGTCDLILKRKGNPQMWIIDLKFSKNISAEARAPMAKYPFDGKENCTLHKYELQLNLYGYMLFPHIYPHPYVMFSILRMHHSFANYRVFKVDFIPSAQIEAAIARAEAERDHARGFFGAGHGPMPIQSSWATSGELNWRLNVE